jgi:hypothetical protein
MEMHNIQATKGNGRLDDGRSESRRLSLDKINSRLRKVVIFMSNQSSIFTVTTLQSRIQLGYSNDGIKLLNKVLNEACYV